MKITLPSRVTSMDKTGTDADTGTKMALDDVVKRAECFAAERHAGQVRKDGRTPFITHPAEIVSTLRGIGVQDADILASAWLHDVVEDTGTAMEEIYDRFGKTVGLIVDTLTRQEGREEYNKKVTEGCVEARIIKLADLEHNWRTIYALSTEAQERKLRETEDLYLPLAERMRDNGEVALYDLAKLCEDLRGHVQRYNGQTHTPDETGDRTTHLVVRLDWLESERGWGMRPDGYSLHETSKDCDEFVREYWDRMPDEVPECYSRPDGSAYPFEADLSTYAEVTSSECGIRRGH